MTDATSPEMPSHPRGPNPLSFVPLAPGELRPCHRSTIYEPGQPPRILSEEIPLGKIAGRYWCKYCYTTHTQWWMMEQDAYRTPDYLIILCGHCAHTTGIAKDGEQLWWATGAFDEEEDEEERAE